VRLLGISLILLITTLSCAPKLQVDGKVDVSGTVVQQITVSGLDNYFTQVCQTKQPTDLCYNPDINQCINCSVIDFLSKAGL